MAGTWLPQSQDFKAAAVRSSVALRAAIGEIRRHQPQH
jgi:hypothetical protein